MLKANYHTHLLLCGHAIGMSEDYVKEALNLGYIELGISDHAFVPKKFMSKKEYLENFNDELMDEKTFYDVYLKDIEMVQKKYPMIKIYKALETEFLEEHLSHYQFLRNQVDYLILGIHFIKYQEKIVSPYNLFTKDMLASYVDTSIKAMETNLYKIFGHPDLFMYQYIGDQGPYIFDEYAINASKKIIESAIKNNVYLEYNASGLFKGGRTINNQFEYYYPRSEFWKIVATYPNVKVLIGCDAHKPSELGGDHLIEAINNLKSLNIEYDELMK